MQGGSMLFSRNRLVCVVVFGFDLLTTKTQMQGGFDLGGVRENGEEHAYQIARSIEPTPGSPLAPGREFS